MLECVNQRTAKVLAKYAGTNDDQILKSFLMDCQLRNLTGKTIDCYFERIDYFLRFLQERSTKFKSTDKKMIQQYILLLKGKVSEATINGRIRVYRRFFNFLCGEELFENKNPMDGIALLRMEKRVKEIVELKDIQKIIAKINRKTFVGHRNLVMILLLWDGMLRKTELLTLKTSEIELDRRMIKVFGKGRKERMVPLGNKTLRVLHQYISKWRMKISGDHLICKRNGDPLKGRHCHKIIQQLGARHGIKLHPHLIRHSAATYYIREGGNPVILQGIMGHSSLSVTQQYLHLSSQDALASYGLFSPSRSLKV